MVALYDLMIGKSLSDKEVADFITSNNCFSSNQFQLCKDKGIALWTDSNQVVKTVYLYSGNADGFKRYQGKLPYKLSFYDPMWKVEEKLKELEDVKLIRSECVSPLFLFFPRQSSL